MNEQPATLNETTPATPETPPRPAPSPRLVVVETVYHQPPQGSPQAAESRWLRTLASDEQPYVRRVKIGEAWQPLDHGWLAVCSLALVANEAVKFAVVPTGEQRQEAAAQVLEVAFALPDAGKQKRTMHDPPLPPLTPVLEVPPGESLRCSPLDLETVRLRCRKGVATVLLTLYPK
jgi:hypothetical protein